MNDPKPSYQVLGAEAVQKLKRTQKPDRPPQSAAAVRNPINNDQHFEMPTLPGIFKEGKKK